MKSNLFSFVLGLVSLTLGGPYSQHLRVLSVKVVAGHLSLAGGPCAEAATAPQFKMVVVGYATGLCRMLQSKAAALVGCVQRHYWEPQPPRATSEK